PPIVHHYEIGRGRRRRRRTTEVRTMKTLTLVSLLLATACATTTAQSGAPMQACEKGQAAVLNRGSWVYTAPDSTSKPVEEVRADQRVCAASDVSGFGFRHVNLPDGRDGYVSESSLSL